MGHCPRLGADFLRRWQAPQVFKQFGKATKAFKDGQSGADEELDVTHRALASDVPDAQEVTAKAKESA